MRVVFLLLLCAACTNPPVRPVNAPLTTARTLDVSSTELGNAYFENEVAADERFKNVLLTVSGEVDEIVDRGTTLHIGLRSTHNILVRCFFADREQTKKIAILKTGDLTTLSGENLGLNNRFIELKDCQTH